MASTPPLSVILVAGSQRARAQHAVDALAAQTVARTAREAFAAGWGARFVATFPPVQFAGHAAWLAGEARACGDRLVA